MKRSYLPIIFSFSMFSHPALSQQNPDPISAYYNHLKELKAKGSPEMAFLSVGSGKTGRITWLSGHMKTIAPLTTLFTDGNKVAQIDVKFSDNYTWGCGCNK